MGVALPVERATIVLRPESTAGLVPEAVVVVLDHVWSPEKRVVITGAGRGPSPQQAGDAPQHVAAIFLAAAPDGQRKRIGLDV